MDGERSRAPHDGALTGEWSASWSAGPLVRALARHPSDAIPKRNAKVFVNGSPRAFAYNPRNGLITVRRTNLPPRMNVVRIVAVNGSGNTATRV